MGDTIPLGIETPTVQQMSSAALEAGDILPKLYLKQAEMIFTFQPAVILKNVIKPPTALSKLTAVGGLMFMNLQKIQFIFVSIQ